jgi:hypothetical protein
MPMSHLIAMDYIYLKRAHLWGYGGELYIYIYIYLKRVRLWGYGGELKGST